MSANVIIGEYYGFDLPGCFASEVAMVGDSPEAINSSNVEAAKRMTDRIEVVLIRLASL